MNERRIEQALRARPPADPGYIPTLDPITVGARTAERTVAPHRAHRGVAVPAVLATMLAVGLLAGLLLLRPADSEAPANGTGTIGPVAFVLGDGIQGELTVYDPDTGTSKPVTGATHWAWSFSPDGSRVLAAATAGGNLHFVADVASGERTMVEIPGRGIAGLPSWSPDGARLVVATGIGDTWPGTELPAMAILDAIGQTVGERTPDEHRVTSLVRDLVPGASPAWSPDGRWIAYVVPYSTGVGRSSGLYLVRPDGTHAHAIGGAPPADCHWFERIEPCPARLDRLAWSPDSRWIATRSRSAPVEGSDDDIWLVPVGEGEPRRLRNPGADDISPIWSPDGSMLAWIAPDRRVDGTERTVDAVGVWIANADGGEPRRVGADRTLSPDLAWSADGSRLLDRAIDPQTGRSHELVLIDPSGEAATTTLVDTFEIAPNTWLGDSLATVAVR